MSELTANAELIKVLQAIERNTKEIANWLQIAYGAELKKRLDILLDDERKRLAYHYSTEENSSRVVAQLSGVSDASVRTWWREWAELGLVELASIPGRFKRRYDLARLGIEIAAAQRQQTGEPTPVRRRRGDPSVTPSSVE